VSFRLAPARACIRAPSDRGKGGREGEGDLPNPPEEGKKERPGKGGGWSEWGIARDERSRMAGSRNL
jgi:hypothetical protein